MNQQQVFDLHAEDVSEATWDSLVDEIHDCEDAFDSCGGGGWCTTWHCTILFCQ